MSNSTLMQFDNGFHSKYLQPSCLQNPYIEAHCLKSWMLNNTYGFCLQLFHCNSLHIFIFHFIYFLAADVLFLPQHWLAVSALTPCNKRISTVTIFIMILNRRKENKHKLYDQYRIDFTVGNMLRSDCVLQFHSKNARLHHTLLSFKCWDRKLFYYPFKWTRRKRSTLLLWLTETDPKGKANNFPEVGKKAHCMFSCSSFACRLHRMHNLLRVI